MLFTAYGKVYLVKKLHGNDKGAAYAMKNIDKSKTISEVSLIEMVCLERKVIVVDESFFWAIHIHIFDQIVCV